MKKPKQILKWIENNVDSILLFFIIITSMAPYFNFKHGPWFYGLIGTYFGFWSSIVHLLYKRNPNDHIRNLYNIIAIVMLILGLIGFFVISIHKHSVPYHMLELSVATYFGATLGMFFGVYTTEKFTKLAKK